MTHRPRLFWGNITFERQLEVTGNTPSRSLQRLEAELSSMWLAMARPGDVIYSPQGVSKEFATQLPIAREVLWWDGSSPLPFEADFIEFVPWGWSAAAVHQARAWKCSVVAPPVDVVRFSNSREFSAQQELELSSQLPGATTLHSMGDLRAAVAEWSADQRWVIKANLGHAARERVIGSGSSPDDSIVSWCQRRFTQRQPLYLEPWVDRVSEVGVQWDIPQRGEPRLIGLAELLTSERGEYCGSRVVAGLEASWKDAIHVQREVMSRLQQLGYFGPVGIDAMRYRDAVGETHVRPLQDINARLTMGRMAWEWANCFQSAGRWLHASRSPGPLAVSTSPEALGDVPVMHRTWWIPEGQRSE